MKTDTTPTNEIKVFSLFNQSGGIEEVKPVPTLPYGCKVYNYGYAMDGTISAVISGPDQFGTYKTVIISEFSAGFGRVDKYSRPHSKKFGIGSYFDDNMETFNPEVVQAAITKAEEADKKRAEEKAQQEARDKAEIAALPSKYPYLTPLPERLKTGNNENWKEEHKKREAIKKGNLAAILKHNFPEVKFSIKKISSGDGYDITWTDGPTIKEVEKFSQFFDDHKPDISGDYHDREQNNFQKVFGSVKYIFENRNISPEIIQLRGQFNEIYNGSETNEWEIGTLFGRIIRNQSYPTGAHSFKIERNEEITAGQHEDFYRVTYLMPEKKEAQQVNIEGLTLIDYSPKAVAIVGNTKEIKDTLKELGGRWNKFLSCGAGWIFPKTKEAELKAVLGI